MKDELSSPGGAVAAGAAGGRATAPRPFVFVVMPFSDSFRDAYEMAIRPACEEAGGYCERVDEQLFEGGIVDRIFNQIAKADVIVAEMTGRNANVFYETGYAHALDKRVVLLTEKVEDIPFDLKDFPHVVHGGRLRDLKSGLSTRLEWLFSHPRESVASTASALELLLDGEPLAAGSETVVRSNSYHWGANHGFPILLTAANAGSTTIPVGAFDVAVEVEGKEHRGVAVSEAQEDLAAFSLLEGGRTLHHAPAFPRLYPRASHTAPMHLVCSGASAQQLTIHLYREFGPQSFRARIEPL